MSKLVTIYGGSGFVGRYIARRLAKQGWRIRVAVRRPNEALFVKSYGAVGQVEPVLCNIRDEASTRAALIGADAVINCVGTMDRGGRNNFDAVAEGAGRIARLAAAEGVGKLVHISAMGAAKDAPSLYGRAKAAAEDAVLAAYPAAVILRPSLIFGSEDHLFNKFAGLAGLSPVLPISGGATEIQPVYVDDVAQAAVNAIAKPEAQGVYELGGPVTATLSEILQTMLTVVQRRRLILNLPAGLMKLPALAFDLVEMLSGGLIKNALVTRDQIDMLKMPLKMRDGAKGLADLDVDPVAMELQLPEYLWRFRPSGQYAAIKASAKNLKKV